MVLPYSITELVHTSRQDLREQRKQHNSLFLFLLGIEVWISSRSFAILFHSMFLPWFFCLFHCMYWLQTICCECSPPKMRWSVNCGLLGSWAKALLLSNASSRAVVSAPKTHKAATGAQVLLLPSIRLSVCPTRTVVRWANIVCNQGKETQESLHFFLEEQFEEYLESFLS